MRLSGFDLEELLGVLNRSDYSRNLQDIPQLPGVAFCRGPQTYFPNHHFAFAAATETGINAGIFRKQHGSPELIQGDYMKLLVDFTEEVPHHGLCDADVPGITNIAICRSGARNFNGHSFLFQLTTPKLKRKVDIFRIH